MTINQKRLVETFVELAKIDSESFFEKDTAIPAHPGVPSFQENVVLTIPYPAPKHKQKRKSCAKNHALACKPGKSVVRWFTVSQT